MIEAVATIAATVTAMTAALAFTGWILTIAAEES